MKQNISALPERRNPQLATAEGSEGRAPEIAALMVSIFYSCIDTFRNIKTVNFRNASVAGELCATDRNSRGRCQLELTLIKFQCFAVCALTGAKTFFAITLLFDSIGGLSRANGLSRDDDSRTVKQTRLQCNSYR